MTLFGGLRIVWIPDRGGGGGCGSRAGFLSENGRAISAFGENNSAGQARNARADDSDGFVIKYQLLRAKEARRHIRWWGMVALEQEMRCQ